MNSLRGHITTIETSGSMSIVTVTIGEQFLLRAIVIETPETAGYLQKGRNISLLFKETEVIICTGDTNGISLQNKIPATIQQVEKGALLSKIILNCSGGPITSIISTQAVTQLELKEQLPVTALVKLNDVMLSEI